MNRKSTLFYDYREGLSLAGSSPNSGGAEVHL